jgi:hypothetical protein
VDLSRGKEGMNFSRNRTLNVNPKIFTLSRDRSAWGHYSKRVKVKGGGGNRGGRGKNRGYQRKER